MDKVTSSPFKYPFRSQSTGGIHWVDFETMMTADCMGVIEIDGEQFRRARDLEQPHQKRSRLCRERVEIVSDSAGFIAEQLPDMEAHRKAHGHRGIEFTPDPSVDGFMQVRASSPRAFNRYIRDRGLADHNSKNGSGAMLTPGDLDRAKQLAKRVYS